MNRKQELSALTFLTLFLAVMLISAVVNYFTKAGSSSILMIICFAGGLVCTAIAWIQYFKGKKKDEE